MGNMREYTLGFPWGLLVNIQLYPHAWVGKPSILNGMDVGVTEIDTQNVNDAKQYIYIFFWLYHQVGDFISRHGS